MKTVEILAKYLHQWPEGYSRLVHIEGIFFGTPTDHNSTLLAMSNESLAGFAPAEDSGTSVTKDEWLHHKFKTQVLKPGSACVVGITIPSGSVKPSNSDEHKGEVLYAAKLQCLSDAMLKNGAFSKVQAESIAEAINSGFDTIK